MARRGAALFRAVVLLGAELTACSKVERALPTRQSLVQPSAPTQAAATPGLPTAANQAPSVPDAGATPAPLEALAVTSAVPRLVAAASAAPKASARGSKKRPCPPNSELEFPPCYYIL